MRGIGSQRRLAIMAPANYWAVRHAAGFIVWEELKIYVETWNHLLAVRQKVELRLLKRRHPDNASHITTYSGLLFHCS
jgi:hypothetical protein